MAEISRKEPSDTIPKKLDDLTAIKGIGQITQRWLRGTFNVRTYYDLAALSVDEIEVRLKADGKIAFHSRIEKWIVQAQAFASSTSSPIYSQQLTVLESDEWPRLATFVVAFEERQAEGKGELQIKAEHHEADEWQVWKGMQLKELSQWMLTQLGDRVSQPTPVQQSVQTERETEQTDSTDKLQEYIAKARQLAGEVIASHTGITAHQLPIQQTTNVEPTILMPTSEETSYSDKLQRYIQKAHNLAETGN